MKEAASKTAVTKVEDEMRDEARLMLAAQKFAVAFDEQRGFGDQKRLEYMLVSWRELALAAFAYAHRGSSSASSDQAVSR